MCYDVDLIAFIGREKLLALQQRFGGSRIYIPAKAEPDGELAELVGEQAAKTLSAVYGPTLLHIGTSLAKQERNRRIVTARQLGAPIRDVAQRYGLTARSVRKITQGLGIGRGGPVYGLRRRQLQRVLTVPRSDDTHGRRDLPAT